MCDAFSNACTALKIKWYEEYTQNGDVETMADLEYPKIDTLYNRDGERFVNVSRLRRREFAMIKRWYITEKIHGTNTRITLFDNGEVVYGGRTDEAEMPQKLLDYLTEIFTPEKMKKVFWLPNKSVPKSVTIYGEGYGPGIVPGSGVYRSDVAFRLFDCLVKGDDGNWWLERHSLEDIAKKLGIKCVPLLGVIDFLPMCVEEVKRIFIDNRDRMTVVEDGGQVEFVSDGEGIIAKPYPELLFNRKGERIMWKLKIKDFERTV